jgi:hypothetical protein
VETTFACEKLMHLLPVMVGKIVLGGKLNSFYIV